MAEAAPKRRGRPKGSKNRPRSDNVNDDGYFTGLSLSKIHSMWKTKTGKTTTLDQWKERWAGNTKEIRRRLIAQIQGQKTRMPIDKKTGAYFIDKKGRPQQYQYSREYFKGWHLTQILKFYQKRTADMRPLDYWKNLYNNSHARVRTALIKCINGKPPRKPKTKAGPDGRKNNTPPPNA